ncbi:MAG: hypothetical protein GY861_25595 [bacterium]|nr:hypothetical protein [bacterium]
MDFLRDILAGHKDVSKEATKFIFAGLPEQGHQNGCGAQAGRILGQGAAEAGLRRSLDQSVSTRSQRKEADITRVSP